MLFTSFQFFCFLPLAFVLYWAMPRRSVAQNACLIVISMVFYGLFGWKCLVLMVLAVLWTYLFARKRWNLALAIAGPLGVLLVFKYYDFFVSTLVSAIPALASQVSTLGLIVPVGVSFYTFMAISYLIDVHQGKLEAERNLIDFAVYLMFFPQLAAGPIGRAPIMLPQFNQPRVFDYPLAVEGCRQMLWGFFKKILVADSCAVAANELLRTSQSSSIGIWVGVLVYTVQIYADFSGYSDMAIGCGKLFGIRLMRNFAYPYFATNIGDFWRRWHMTLTRWFTDYIYIPMGGSRCSKGRQIVNTLVVFLTSGLWHGAAWNFIAWGGVHGCLFVPKILRPSKIKVLLSWALTLFCVAVVWALFRAQNIAEAGHWYAMMFMPKNLSLAGAGLATCGLEKAMIFGGIMFVWEWISRAQELVVLPRNLALRWSTYLALVVAIFLYYPQAENFIYFQF